MNNWFSCSLFVVLFGCLMVSCTAKFSIMHDFTGVPNLPVPFVPKVTVTVESHPYDVPTTYGIDQFTGENVTIQEGQYVENKSIVFTIKKQHASDIFYNIRYKGSFGDVWTELYSYSQYSTGSLVPQSDSDYTVISIPAIYPFRSGATVDFQVRALAWTYTDIWIADHPMAPAPLNEIGHYEERFTFGAKSAWSETQTITLEEENSTKTLDEEPTEPEEPTIPINETAPEEPTIKTDSNQTDQLALILGIIAILVAFAALVTGLVVYFKICKPKL